MILGGGPNRIGQGIEFDYCCCHASFSAQDQGFATVMLNSNPETVSTDYDSSDRLYFEPLTLEDVLNVIEAEHAKWSDCSIRWADTSQACIASFELALHTARSCSLGLRFGEPHQNLLILQKIGNSLRPFFGNWRFVNLAMVWLEVKLKRGRLQATLATPLLFVPLTSWVGAPWKLCTTRQSSIAT